MDCDLLIEPVNDLVETYYILLATILVRLKPNGLYFYILNPQDNEIPLKRNSVIGTVELSNITPHVVMEVAEESEEYNYDPVCRLSFDQRSIVNSQTHQCPQGKYFASEAVRHITTPLKTAHATNQPPPPLLMLDEAYSDGKNRTNSVTCLTTITEHAIETGDARSVKQAPRRPPMALVSEGKKAIDKLLRQGVIPKSNSPWQGSHRIWKEKFPDFSLTFCNFPLTIYRCYRQSVTTKMLYLCYNFTFIP